jgi:hypothetical protein
MAYVSRSPPIIPDGQISRVRFETLAFFRRPSQVWRGLNAGPYTPPPFWFASSLAPGLSWRCAGFIRPAAIRPRKPPSVLSPFAQLRCYLRWGDVSAISSEGVTPPSSLLRAHVPLPLGSLLLRHLASFEESWQVVRSPCCPRELPDVISENLSLDAGSHTPAVHRVLSPVSSTMSSAFPKRRWVGFPRLSHELRLLVSRVSRLQIFLYVPASKFAHPPDRSYRCEYCRRAAGAFPSGPIVLCYLHTHRIC